MSRELDPTGMAQLNRSISTDSLSSISSIANNFGHDFTVGQLEVTLEFEPSRHPSQGTGLLHMTLHQGKDLLEKEEGDFPGCFIRVSLGPEEINIGVTRVRKRLSSPVVPACICNRVVDPSFWGWLKSGCSQQPTIVSRHAVVRITWKCGDATDAEMS